MRFCVWTPCNEIFQMSHQSKSALAYNFFDTCYFFNIQPFTIKPQHINVPSGTYYPNDEDLSWLKEMGTDKCPILATNHMSSICQCQVM